ncbi:MAG: isochorismatase family protein [Planctomycetaceae bacterium]|nr:isochorismatase family protein [Planctomycetaceae bacterium]
MRYDRIIMDIQAQDDFLSSSGACYLPPAAVARRNISALFRWARQDEIPVISTVLRVHPHRIGPMADVPHCVDGTAGEEKIAESILPRRINFGLRNTTDLPDNVLEKYQQVIFEMRFTDIFKHERAERLLTELNVGTFILCGAGLSQGIQQAAVGLRSRGFAVVLARDAVVALPGPGLEMALKQIQAKGVIFAPTSEIVLTHPVRRRQSLRLQPQK